MAQSLEVLELAPEILQALQAAGLDSILRLRDSTLASLDACGLSDSQSLGVLSRLDSFLDRRFQSQVLFPMLPEPCQYVECAFLQVSSDLLVRLESHRFQYLYELAMSRRPRLVEKLGPEAVTEIEGALAYFVGSYRQGEIVLQVEEKIYEG